MTGQTLHLMQVSDLHGLDDDAQTDQCLAEVEAAVARLKPDIVVWSGDITQDAYLTPGLFDAIRRKILDITPAALILPGNHDVGNHVGGGGNEVAQAYVDSWLATFGDDRFVSDHGRWRLIGLNSLLINSDLPREAEQLDWLTAEIQVAKRANQQVAVFTHQPPYLFQPDERFGDHSDYWAINAVRRAVYLEQLRKPHVKLVANGHLHWYRADAINNASWVWCPSLRFPVDDSKFPAGGSCVGLVMHRLTDEKAEHELITWPYEGETYYFRRPAVELPNKPPIKLANLVLDFTGTLSRDGRLLDGIADLIREVSKVTRMTVLTADTFGRALTELEDLPVSVRLISTGEDKAAVVRELGSASTVTIGNGRNDVPMVREAAIGIAVVGPEGAAGDVIRAADVVVRDIREGLSLMLNPLRLKATLRD